MEFEVVPELGLFQRGIEARDPSRKRRRDLQSETFAQSDCGGGQSFSHSDRYGMQRLLQVGMHAKAARLYCLTDSHVYGRFVQGKRATDLAV